MAAKLYNKEATKAFLLKEIADAKKKLELLEEYNLKLNDEVGSLKRRRDELKVKIARQCREDSQ